MDASIDGFEAGGLEDRYQYRAFLPNFIDRQWRIEDPEIHTLLADANRYLGELNAFSQLIPDVDFFIRMHITKEATTSSRIEGTQTNMEEALVEEQDVDPERRDDWQEVRNYVAAINHAIESLEHLPLSNRLLRDTHRVLMQGVRGKHKQPGEFRASQNWIGVNLKHATFIPPHHDHVPDLMSDLERFMHDEAVHVPHLIRIALIHYQFETIHPFLDGNGRLGRLLIVLYLVGFGLLSRPALYLSDFFERHKGEYYDRLMAVRTHNDLVGWLRFFLIGVSETATQSIDVFKAILTLKERIERAIIPSFHVRRVENAQQLMRHLYQNPVISIRQLADQLHIQPNTANKLIVDFEKLGILRELTGRKRDRLYIFDDYVRLFLR